ncbi:L-aspartate oxidase [Ancylomarina sp. DW003]|nr:L-aspartate oxidase [Ancylomarina sp. DW003]MDE5421113.1 L-aspartate oxidase [Ancylomarina sp. DW003]
MFTEKEFDFLIIGSGLAGLYAASCAADLGRVVLVTKTDLNVSNSYYAQGGIAAVTNSDDSPDLHLKDTFEAGRGLCDFSPVNILVNEGPDRIKDLIDMGMQFDTLEGELSRGLEGGHLRRRVLHAGGDSTGKELIKFLTDKVLSNKNIEVLENQMVYKLLCQNKKCYGALTYKPSDNTNLKIIAKNTFLAMGGASAIYQRTTNPNTTVGDGIALAYAEGAEVSDMEFIQFHPSAFYSEDGNTFLISEAVRGEGAQLYNQKGERFMLNKHELAELAPRDVVARSIFEQMQTNKDEFVYLRLSHLDSEKIKKRFPTLYKKCADFGVDMCHQVPIAPAAHYMVGGIKTGLNGETNIANLYCFGELASSGVMGANRLASNSLLECLVFGKRAIIHASNQNKLNAAPKFEQDELYCNKALEEDFLNQVNAIANAMNTNLGIVRDEKSMKELTDFLNKLKTNFPFENNEYYSTRMQNLIHVCLLMTKAAIQRKESRGGHIRSDFEHENKAYIAHSIQTQNKDLFFVPIENK